MGGVQVGRWVGGWVFSQWLRWGKSSVQTSSNRFLKTLTEGAVTTEAGSLFQYFTTLTENADLLLRRLLVPWSTLKATSGGRKNKFGLISKRPLNILKAVMRSSRSRRRCKEWRPVAAIPLRRGGWRMPVTNLGANLWIRSRWLMSATRFGEQAGIPYSRCGRTKAPYKGMLLLSNCFKSYWYIGDPYHWCY